MSPFKTTYFAMEKLSLFFSHNIVCALCAILHFTGKVDLLSSGCSFCIRQGVGQPLLLTVIICDH